MIKINKLKPLKKLTAKLTYSLVVATIITSILFFLPKMIVQKCLNIKT